MAASNATALRSAPLFARVTSAADLQEIQRLSRCEEVAAGTALTTLGVPVESIDLILSGEASVRRGEGTLEFLRLGAGSLVGELEFFKKTSCVATVTASRPMRLLRISYADLDTIAEKNPMTGMQLYQGFLSTVAGKLRLVTDSLVDVKLDTSREHLAHDLKSPLAVLRILADSATSLPEDERELLHQVTLRIESIIQGLRDGGAKAQQRPETQGFADLLRHVIAEKHVEVGAGANIELQSSIPPAFKCFRPGPFATELSRVVSNILNNAIEATRPVGGCVTLRCRESETEFALDVHDSGAGMTAEFIDRLGTRPLTAGKPDGQGIGLFYAFRLVESLGGCMVIQSEKGSGTLVGFRLPARALQRVDIARLHTGGPARLIA